MKILHVQDDPFYIPTDYSTTYVSDNSIFTCPRCKETKIRDEDAITLECNHVVCRQCLKAQLSNCEK